MPYTITAEIRRKAASIGVTVKPSNTTGKKLDAYKNGEKQASFGASGYGDYHVFKREKGAEYAAKKRAAYKKRHESDRHIRTRNGKLTAGYLADKILW